MAHDDRPGDDPKPKRRGKAPIITLEAADVTPPPAADSAATEAPSGESQAPDAPAAEPVAAIPGENPSAEPKADDAALAHDRPPTPDAVVTPQEPAGIDPAAAPVPAEPPPPAPHRAEPEPASGGFGRLVAAGVVGALLTGGLGIGALSTGLLPTASSDGAARDARIGDLETQLRQMASRPAPATAPAPDLTPLARRIEALDAARAALETRLAALEQRPASATAGTAPASTSSAAPVDLAPLRAEIDGLKAEVTRLAARPAETAPAPSVSPADIDGRIAAAVTAAREAAERRIAALEGDIRTARSALAELAPKIAGLETARGQAGDSGRRAALVVSLGALRAAVERGQSYAAELRAAASLGLPADAVSALEPQAERGLPTIAALTQRFTALAPDLLKAAGPATSDGSLLDRLTQSAQSLVRVRPVGEAAGDDVPTVVARIEAKLRRSDLAGALADLDKLPERVKTSATAFAAEARARLGADTTLRRLSAEAATAMGGG
ncbi:mitofilin family membrane protein [Phreatobacter sp.]|uniref:COG4223 family protein n=1 Tax=Phreatobacter sp. TaxID=1966341 RepID=UPI0022C4AED8|nr:mitofilin family membrane protein [Phreatobacter sp.]MCZ8316829.1 mitofilin family membrane protein [Phreatobacter sp.]